jgi:hypothetical protein
VGAAPELLVTAVPQVAARVAEAEARLREASARELRDAQAKASSLKLQLAAAAASAAEARDEAVRKASEELVELHKRELKQKLVLVSARWPGAGGCVLALAACRTHLP